MIELDQALTTRPEVAAALRALETKHGKLTPEVVFEAAKTKSSPLHKFFEWDQANGWRKHNLTIARTLIRTVVYHRTVTDHGTVQPRRVPAYVRDPKAKAAEQGYVALRKVVANSPSAHSIVLREIAAAEGALNRALAVAGAIGFAEEITDLLKRVGKVRTRAEKASVRAPKSPSPDNHLGA